LDFYEYIKRAGVPALKAERSEACSGGLGSVTIRLNHNLRLDLEYGVRR
jgi:hypothetical protein